MPIPTARSSRIPHLGSRKVPASGSSSSSSALPRTTSFLQPRGSIAAAATGAASHLPPPHHHAPSKLQGPALANGDALPPSARFTRSHSTPMAPAARSNQVAAPPAPPAERPQLTIQVPAPSLALSSTAPFQSLVPPSPSTHNDNIRVLLRIRPPKPAAAASSAGPPQQLSRRCLDVAPDAKGVTLAPATLQEKRFGFDQVFTETSSQEQIFLDVGVTAVENTLNGFNGCIFAYGQTGSGKTFTMLGGTGSSDVAELRASPLRGLIPRIFAHLFERLSHVAAERGSAAALDASVACSYLEIYNEKVFDLLEETAATTAQPKSLRENATKGVYVESLREVPIATEAEAIEWLQLGSSNRRMASTDMNRESSRSHAVFTIKLVQTERTATGVQFTRRSNLHLVDLAGSEKQSQTKAAGQRLKEAAQINKSLSALGNVIMSLVDVSNGQKRHVHYRDSKLTFLLKDSLGGNAITTIVATISGEEKYFSETLSTLKFAQRAKFIKNKAVQNQDSDAMLPLLKLEIERLRHEIATLRAGGAIAAAPSSGPTSSSSSSSPDDALKLSPASYHQLQQQQAQLLLQLQQQQQSQEVKKNRWEPALDVMDKLLRASGAAGPADLDEHEVCDPVEMRCERLEMLLYRMICRYEEHKALAFTSDRSRHALFRRPVVLMKSGLRAPKKYGITAAASSENQHDAGRFLTPAEEKAIYDEIARGSELERENNLMRQELCELLEWKALVEDERKHGNADADGYSTAAAPPESASQNDELMELLSAYRSLFDDIAEVVRDKRPVLSSPPSPGSSFTEDNSVSYASGGEDDGDDRDFASSNGGDDNDVDPSEDGDVSATYREIRRAHALSVTFERKLDQYQDAVQRLEKDLLATQDELETSSAATKFAEFQLQQLRTLASDEEARQLELEATIASLQRSVAAAERALAESQALVATHEQALEAARASAAASAQADVAELDRLRALVAASESASSELATLRAAAAGAEQAVSDKSRALDDVRAQLAATTSELETMRQSLTVAQRDTEAKDQALGASRAELETLHATLAARDGDLSAKDRALDDAASQLRALTTDLESLRLELATAKQAIGSKEHVLEDANSQLVALRSDVETLRQALATAQSEVETKSRAVDALRAEVETSRQDASELDDLRSALTAARRSASEKSRLLEDAKYQIETLQMERDDIAQRTQREREKRDAAFAKTIREYEAREQEHEDEIQRLRDATPPRRKSKSSEQENAGMELALLAAQNIIQQLEDELTAYRSGSDSGAAAPAPSSGDAMRLQSELDAALAENARLQEMVESLQTQASSSQTRAVATRTGMRREEAEEEKSSEPMVAMMMMMTAQVNEPQDVRRSCRCGAVVLMSDVKPRERLTKSSADRSVLSPTSSMHAITKQNREIKRLAGERAALNSRLQQTQQKMKRLEEELTRSRNSQVASRSLATEFFCEM